MKKNSRDWLFTEEINNFSGLSTRRIGPFTPEKYLPRLQPTLVVDDEEMMFPFISKGSEIVV